MTKQKNKTATETAPAQASAAASPSEQYKQTDSGFVLVRTLKGGTVTETPLSNFTASIIAELVSVDEKGGKSVDGVVVETRFGDWTKTERVPASVSALTLDYYANAGSFDERLLKFALSIHPMASVMPNREKHVVAAIKTLSKPQQIVKENNKGKNPNLR